MFIDFQSKKLELLLNSKAALLRTYEEKNGLVIMRRISELKAARCLADLRTLPQLYAHEIEGTEGDHISITIQNPLHMVLFPNNEPIPRLSTGKLDWKATTAVKVIAVTGYN